VQFPKFAIEVFPLWNFANHLKKNQRFCKPLHSFKLFAFASLSHFAVVFFMVNSKRFSHVIRKAATRIVQNMLRKSASSCCRYPQVIWFSKRVSEIQEKEI